MQSTRSDNVSYEMQKGPFHNIFYSICFRLFRKMSVNLRNFALILLPLKSNSKISETCRRRCILFVAVVINENCFKIEKRINQMKFFSITHLSTKNDPILFLVKSLKNRGNLHFFRNLQM